MTTSHFVLIIVMYDIIVNLTHAHDECWTRCITKNRNSPYQRAYEKIRILKRHSLFTFLPHFHSYSHSVTLLLSLTFNNGELLLTYHVNLGLLFVIIINFACENTKSYPHKVKLDGFDEIRIF